MELFNVFFPLSPIVLGCLFLRQGKMFSIGSTKEVCIYYLIKARQRVERLTSFPSTFLLVREQVVLSSSQNSLTFS